MAALLVATVSANAQLPLQSVGSPFDVVGFIQSATLDTPRDTNAGGTITVNGCTIIVPRNTVLQMPANAITWQQVFAMAPAPYTGSQTGLALTDSPAPLTTYEVHVQGNRVGDKYIAGLIFISQQSLNSGQGFINYIDYANGELHVGGTIGDPNTGTRVKIDDPLGRFAPAFTLDPRFTIDEDNPTVRTETGFPMCLPRVNPTVGIDTLCPQTNRPKDPLSGQFQTIFTMNPPGFTGSTDPMVAAPFEIGDFVTYAGTLMKDGNQPSAGPLPANALAGTFIAAHTIIANLGIFTSPGTNPAYVAIDVAILGVGGIPIQGIPQETTARTRFEGFTTDPSRVITLAGMDVDSCTQSEWDRDWGMSLIDQGPPLGAVLGRWRFRPPDRILLGPMAGVFLPPTRNVRAVLSGAWDPWDPPVVSTNGLQTGQYNAPIFNFLFPENLGVGNPPVPMNFTDFPFLVNGTYGVTAGNNVGQLTPWPGTSVTPPICGAPASGSPPTANAGPNQFVTAGAQVTLDGSGSFDPSGLAIGYTWLQTVGPTVNLNSFFITKPTFTAPAIPAGQTGVSLQFQLTVTNENGQESPASYVTINVTPQGAVVQAPKADAGAAQSVPSGSIVQLNGLGSYDPNTPARTPLSYAWTQTSGTAVALSNAATPTPTFTAPIAPAGSNLTLTFALTVVNSVGISSTAATTTVTVTPVVAPVANAGTNQVVMVGTAVNLTAAASSDPNGLPLTYAWKQTLGTTVTVSGGNTASPTFTAPPAATVITFQLTVSNGFLSATSTVTVTVVSQPDQVTITVASYSSKQQRLTVTATSSTAGGFVTLSLVGYGPNGGDVLMPFTPGVGANNTYTIVLNAVPIPSMWTVTVNSSLGGSATSALTKIK